MSSFRRMTRRGARIALLPALFAVCLTYCTPTRAQVRPNRVILFIGDGVGTAYWTAALLSADTLAVAAFPVAGLTDTRADPEIVTDSAASATAFATGISTYNGAISVGPDRRPSETVLELAERLGLSTGLVATCSLTHATPAAFAAHVERRSMQEEIAEQMSRQGIEVLLGGGLRYFDRRPERGASNILEEMRAGVTFVGSAEEFRGLELNRVDRLIGLFAGEHMPRAAGREPTLPEMTRAALAVLDRDPDGFFLMVEGSQPDWCGHENAELEEVTAEVLDFDRAIAEGLAYRKRRPRTLIVVVADHETGGLAVEGAGSDAVMADYTTTSHTAEMTPLFAIGPGAERFGGIHSNAEVGRMLLEVVGGGRD